MRINTNVSALTSLSNLNKVQDAVSSSMEKLSSGFRINKAGDDAAGLGISNQLNADIRAMTQASRNAEQAGSVLQIMDGASQNVSSILERMKELAAQSASDTVDSGARTKINNEFGTLSDELDRIVSTTKFQGASLLNGSFGSKATTTGTVKTAASTLIGGDVASVTVSTAPTFSKFGAINAAVSVIGQTAPATVTGSADTVTVNSQSLVDTLTSAPLTLATSNTASTIGATAAGALTIGAGNIATAATATTASVAGDYTITAAAGSDGTHTTFTLAGPGGYSSVLTDVVDGSSSLAFTGGINLTLDNTKAQADYTGGTFSGKKIQVRQAYTVTLSGGGVASPNSANIVDNGTAQNAVFGNFGLTVGVATNTASSLNTKGIALTEKLQLTLSGVNATSGLTQTQSVALNASPASQDLSFDATFGTHVVLGASATGASLKSAVNTGGKNQIVQNASRQAQFLVSSSQSYSGNDLISLDTVDLTAGTLGVTKTAVDLTTATGAQSALATIDSAISIVGNAIGAIGAAENRITYADANVKTAIQNFTAANSAIKDVDMAAEMTMFSKNQILSQAGTAMLAQANQLGASVLQLLK